MTELHVSSIQIGGRVRRDMGDIAALAASIADIGLLHPVVVTPAHELVAGQRRLEAIASLGWETVPIRVVDIEAIALGEHAENEVRKDFTTSERVEIGKLVEAALGNRRGRRTDRLPQNFGEVPHGIETGELAAEKAGFGNPETYRQAKSVVANGVPDLVEKMDSGELSIFAASNIASLPKSEQHKIVTENREWIQQAAKQIWTEKAVARRAETAAMKEQQAAPIPDGKFRVIVIDPPWEVDIIQRQLRPNQVALDYPTMTDAELLAFPVAEMADVDCHLFCWTIARFLPFTLQLVEAWGFRYVLPMVWHKSGGFQPTNLPQYNAEFVIYARKGSPEFRDTKAFPICFGGARREHSRKPDEFYDMIRRVAGGPRIDIFSREPRDGFAQFGNETQKFAS